MRAALFLETLFHENAYEIKDQFLKVSMFVGFSHLVFGDSNMKETCRCNDICDSNANLFFGGLCLPKISQSPSSSRPTSH